jgi:3-deoxy-D-manno-octulosonic acid kinase
VQCDGEGGVIFPDWPGMPPEPWWFEVDAWRQRAALLGEGGGRGRVAFVRSPLPAADDRSGQWVLRDYRRGGMVRHLVGAHYLFTGAQRTRVFREVELLHALHQHGFPVPCPVAGRFVRTGPWYAAALITERLVGAEPLSRRLADGKGALPLAQWRAIGATLRRFHEAGVWHADLNAHNILLDDAGRCFLIDFDRGRWSARAPLAQRLRQRNLERLARSLRKTGALGPPRARAAGADSAAAGWAACLASYRNPA